MIPQGLLPPNTTAFIAGGFAACPALASDIDIWVQVGNPEDIESMRAVLLAHFATEGYMFVEESRSERVRDTDNYGDSIYCTIAKCAKVHLPRLDAHILVTDGSAQDVLRSFDLSTHQVAILQNGRVVKGEDWTPTFEWPTVLKRTPTTQARRQKLVERYQPNGDDPMTVWPPVVYLESDERPEGEPNGEARI